MGAPHRQSEPLRAGRQGDPRVQTVILILPPLLTPVGKGHGGEGHNLPECEGRENGDQVPEMREEVAWVAQ